RGPRSPGARGGEELRGVLPFGARAGDLERGGVHGGPRLRFHGGIAVTPEAWSAVSLSPQVGLWCAVLGLPSAIGLGWVLARREFRLKPLLSAAVFVPLVLPPVVTGLLLLEAFGRNAPLGRALAALGLPVSFSLTGAVVA